MIANNEPSLKHKNSSAVQFFTCLAVRLAVVCSAVIGISNTAQARKSRSSSKAFQITKFADAKKYLRKHLELFDNKTIYCSCQVTEKTVDIESCGYKPQGDAKRAKRLEWEHVVPAEAFGQSFIEWRIGSANCSKHGKKFKGRKCAEKNSEFAKMESDLYNLYPEIGELNGLRSNFSMAEISGEATQFGTCEVKIEGRKFEPQESSKGIVARTYLNFDQRYPDRGVVSGKNRPLFEAWDKMHPVTALECRRWKALAAINGYQHLFVSRCDDMIENKTNPAHVGPDPYSDNYTDDIKERKPNE